MWISRKRWKVFEKRIADLEKQVQSQQKKTDAICDFWLERQKLLSKAGPNNQKAGMWLAMDCATQHIREFLAQSTNREIADLGKACGSNCEIWKAGRCKDFDWLKNLDPIISQSSVKMSVHNAGNTNRG